MGVGPQCIVERVLFLTTLKSLGSLLGAHSTDEPARVSACLPVSSEPQDTEGSFLTLFASCSPWAVFKHDLIATCQAEDGCKMLPYYVDDGVNPGSLLSQQPA